MKVLQINVTSNTGSTGRISEQLGNQIISEGWESYIAYSRKGLPSKSKTIPIGNKLDVYRHVLMTRIFDRHAFSSKNATLRLINEVKRLDPDIIHLHNLHGYYIHIGKLFNYLKNSNVPVVWTFHDCWPFTGHCAHFDRFSCEKWKTGCYQCPMKTYYPSSWLVDNSINNYNKKKKFFNGINNLSIVTPSKWLMNLVEQSFFKGKFRVTTIHNGVDLSVFKPLKNNIKERFNIEKDRLLLGVTGLWSERKGLDDFFRLSNMLDQQYKIILVGLKKEQLKDLPLNIIGIERTENTEELAEFYSAADVYINPTYSDNFPTTNIEALACGTPIITYNTGGSPEAIDIDTGIVVDKGNVEGLQAAIEKVLKGIEQGKQYTRDLCRNRAVHYFNKDERFQEYTELYNRLLTEE